MSAPVIEARDLHRIYRRDSVEVHAVRGVSLSIGVGDHVVVVGPSGSGKSTLLNLLGAIDTPTRGSVRILGAETSDLSDRALTRLRLLNVGFVFQRFHLLPALTALENVELPMTEAGTPGEARRRRARELLTYVGLSDRAEHRPGEMSGGEMQRVAIARALANRPAVVLADEPTGELDREMGRQIAELFGRLNDDGTALVVVTHDPGLSRPGSRTFRMQDGEVSPAGPEAGEGWGARE